MGHEESSGSSHFVTSCQSFGDFIEDILCLDLSDDLQVCLR